MPRYCKECILQGHCEDDCRIPHPELILVVVKEEGEVLDKRQENLNNTNPPLKMLTSGKVVSYPNGKCTQVRDNRRKIKDDVQKEEITRKTLVSVEQDSKNIIEAKGSEAARKEVIHVEHQAKDPLNTNNMFALLEEDEVEEENQRKNGAVINEENKMNVVENKVRRSNQNKKELIIEWVRRRFGMSKEERKELNVNVNHSCQDIPSQSIDDSEMNVATNKIF